MKHFLAAIFGVLFLAGCTINSPLTTTSSWLEALKSQQYDTAVKYMVIYTTNGIKELSDSDINNFKIATKNTYGNITSYTVDKTEPMDDQTLKHYQVAEGYRVFYSIKSEKQNRDLISNDIIKVNNQWKIVEEYITPVNK